MSTLLKINKTDLSGVYRALVDSTHRITEVTAQLFVFYFPSWFFFFSNCPVFKKAESKELDGSKRTIPPIFEDVADILRQACLPRNDL